MQISLKRTVIKTITTNSPISFYFVQFVLNRGFSIKLFLPAPLPLFLYFCSFLNRLRSRLSDDCCCSSLLLPLTPAGRGRWPPTLSLVLLKGFSLRGDFRFRYRPVFACVGIFVLLALKPYTVKVLEMTFVVI